MLKMTSNILTEWVAPAALRAAGFVLVFSSLAGSAHAQTCAPEIDPGSVVGALTLLTGGVLLLTDRLRKKK